MYGMWSFHTDMDIDTNTCTYVNFFFPFFNIYLHTYDIQARIWIITRMYWLCTTKHRYCEGTRNSALLPFLTWNTMSLTLNSLLNGIVFQVSQCHHQHSSYPYCTFPHQSFPVLKSLPRLLTKPAQYHYSQELRQPKFGVISSLGPRLAIHRSTDESYDFDCHI
jgi:hypothetical protein